VTPLRVQARLDNAYQLRVGISQGLFGVVSKDRDRMQCFWIIVKVHLTIADSSARDLKVIDLFDATVSPDGLMNAESSVFLET
jgi:hypothetical protein